METVHVNLGDRSYDVRIGAGLLAGAGAQMPSLPGRSQRSHGPSQLASQHRPSTHSPPEQPFAPSHAAPTSRFGMQAPASQKCPGWQSPSSAQLDGQATLEPSHR